MSLRQLNRSCFLLLLGLAVVVLGNAAEGSDCVDIFACTLDARWPIDLTLNPREQYTRLIIIRKQPGQSVDPEAYLVIRMGANGSVTADYAIPEGESLYNQIREHVAKVKRPDEISAGLSIKTIHLADTAALRRLLREYHLVRMSPATPEALYLDATRYEIVDVTMMNRMVLRMSDSAVLPQNHLITWAKRALAVCGRAATQTRH